MRKDAFKADEWALCPEEIPARVIRAAKKAIAEDDTIEIDIIHPSRGVCHLCGATVKAEKRFNYKWPGGMWTECPNCGRKVYTYRPGSTRFWAAYFVENIATFQRGLDEKTVFVRQWHVVRPDGDVGDGRELLCEVARYAFRGKNIAKWTKEHRGVFFQHVYYDPLPKWQMNKGKKTWPYDDYFNIVMPDRRQMRAIVRGTSCEYINAADYGPAMAKIKGDVNLLDFIKRYIREPAFEKVTKAGYWRLAAECYQCAVDWKAESIEMALGLPKWTLRLKKPIDWTSDDIRKMRHCLELQRKGRISMADVTVAFAKLTDDQLDLLEEAPTLSVAKIAKYAPDEYVESKARVNGIYRLPKGKAFPRDYVDYIRQAKQLNLDLADERVLYPRDFKAAHARTTSMIKYRENEALRGAFRIVAKNLSRYAWEMDGLIIRPAASQKELIREGAALHHCVGGYAEQMAKGRTEIFLIRRKEHPRTPYYTLEYRNGGVIQCRTLNNETAEKNPDVAKFVKQWAATVRAAA